MRPHPVYERKGDDLYVDVPVDYVTAALGGEVQIPTLTGRVTMKVPAGTSGGRVFRLPGQGMPKVKESGRGNLYAKVRTTIPEVMSDEERALLEQIKSGQVREGQLRFTIYNLQLTICSPVIFVPTSRQIVNCKSEIVNGRGPVL